MARNMLYMQNMDVENFLMGYNLLLLTDIKQSKSEERFSNRKHFWAMEPIVREENVGERKKGSFSPWPSGIIISLKFLPTWCLELGNITIFFGGFIIFIYIWIRGNQLQRRWEFRKRIKPDQVRE